MGNIVEYFETTLRENGELGKIRTTKELMLVSSAYLHGIHYANTRLSVTNGEVLGMVSESEYAEIRKWVGTYFARPFYFTFGSDKGFPYRSTYLIIYADSIQDALDYFKRVYPPRPCGADYNCADYYTQEQWDAIKGYEYYPDGPVVCHYVDVDISSLK